MGAFDFYPIGTLKMVSISNPRSQRTMRSSSKHSSSLGIAWSISFGRSGSVMTPQARVNAARRIPLSVSPATSLLVKTSESLASGANESPAVVDKVAKVSKADAWRTNTAGSLFSLETSCGKRGCNIWIIDFFKSKNQLAKTLMFCLPNSIRPPVLSGVANEVSNNGWHSWSWGSIDSPAAVKMALKQARAVVVVLLCSGFGCWINLDKDWRSIGRISSSCFSSRLSTNCSTQ